MALSRCANVVFAAADPSFDITLQHARSETTGDSAVLSSMRISVLQSADTAASRRRSTRTRLNVELSGASTARPLKRLLASIQSLRARVDANGLKRRVELIMYKSRLVI